MNKSLKKTLRELGLKPSEILEGYSVMLYEEPCNCGENIKHNNGGNYHEREWIDIIMGQFAFHVTETTREFMDGDQFDIWLLAPDGFVLKMTGHHARTYEVARMNNKNLLPEYQVIGDYRQNTATYLGGIAVRDLNESELAY